KDRELLLRTPHALLEGILIVSAVLRLTRAYIYIRGEYLTEAEVLESAIAEARVRGHVATRDAGGHAAEITVHRGAGAYICGEETALLASLNGFRGQPSAKPPFPAVSGAFERPTLLNNVETIATIPAILRKGADAYHTLGTEQSGGTHVMSLSGHVLRPGNYEVPMSETMGHLIETLGGGVPEGRGLKAVIPGGASSPILGPEALDLLCAPEALAAAGTMAGSAGVMVIDDTTCIVQLALRTAEFYAHESCGKCTPCREGTRWIVDTLRRIEDGIAAPVEIDLVLQICDNVEGKCLCPLGDACAMPVRSMVKRFREEFDAHVELGSCPLHEISILSTLYPQPRSLLPLLTVSPA
ncbi:MAG: NADH-quinone oxidoreductase subunit, partial [Gaiellales bacterium]|nr:NADH-quinone oxidoreductase subunit [Gaiellales bacterium]